MTLLPLNATAPSVAPKHVPRVAEMPPLDRQVSDVQHASPARALLACMHAVKHKPFLFDHVTSTFEPSDLTLLGCTDLPNNGTWTLSLLPRGQRRDQKETRRMKAERPGRFAQSGKIAAIKNRKGSMRPETDDSQGSSKTTET